MATVTWNPDDKQADIALSSGNLVATPTLSTGFVRIVRATHAKFGGGRWYFECYATSGFPSNPVWSVGLASGNHELFNKNLGNGDTTAHGTVSFGIGAKRTLRYINLGVLGTTVNNYTPADVPSATIGVAYDLWNGNVWIAVDGTWVGGGTPGVDATPAMTGFIVPGNTLPIYPAGNVYNNTNGGPMTARFAESAFAYTPPPGFISIEYPEFDYLGEGSISGVVKELTNGVYVPGAYPVYVYRRDTGEMISATTSAADGSYVINYLPTDVELYVMAIDNSAPIQRSAIVDKVVPS